MPTLPHARTCPPTRAALAVVLMLAASGTAAAQTEPGRSPLDAATQPPADSPATIVKAPEADDPEIEGLLEALTGSFTAEASDRSPALRMNTARLQVEGLGEGLYFEITRADAPATPFRHGVFHPFRHKGTLRLRLFDIAGAPGLKETMTGLWAVPEAFPELTIEQLDPNLDLVMSREGSGTARAWTGVTPHPYPTAAGGAVEMTSTLRIAGGEVTVRDTGFGPDGMRIWGSGEGDAASDIRFRRVTGAGAEVRRTDDGLVVMTLVPPPADAPKLEENGLVAVHYTGWLADGTRFDSSRQPGKNPFQLRIPGSVIRGWNEGLKEIAKGERRRLVIPPALAYGERGTRDGRIPPNSTLIFDVEAVHVDNTPLPTPAAATPPPTSTPPTGGQPTQTPPPDGGEPK